MGDKADDILQSFSLSVENLKSYKTMKERFDTHFIQRRNIIFLKAKFNYKKQASQQMILSQIYIVYQDIIIMEISMKRWSVTELW